MGAVLRLGPVVAVFLLLNVAGLWRRAPYIDEAWTHACGAMAVQEGLCAVAREDTQAPLFPWAVGWVDRLTGSQEPAHALSVAAGLVVLITSALTWEAWRGPGTTPLAVALVATNPLLLAYAHEVRCYAALMACFGVLACLLLTMAREGERTRCSVGVAATCLVAFHLHVIGAVFFVVAAVGEMLSLATWRGRLRALAWLGGAAPWCLPWVYLSREGVKAHQVAEILHPLSVAEWGKVAYYPWFRFGAGVNVSTAKSLLFPLFLVLPVVVAALVMLGARAAARERSTPVGRVVLLLALGPVLVHSAATLLAINLYSPRYLSYTLPIYVLLAARGLEVVEDTRVRRVAVALVALGWAAAYGVYLATNVRPDWPLTSFSI